MTPEQIEEIRKLIDMLNAQAASGLITREILIQSGKVQQLLNVVIKNV